MLLLAFFLKHLEDKNYYKLLAISTELIVIFTIVGTLILDLILPRKSKYYIAAFALFGTLASLAPLVIQWATYSDPIYTFGNSFVVDKFSIILKGLFVLITYLTFLLSINFIESDKFYQGEYY